MNEGQSHRRGMDRRTFLKGSAAVVVLGFNLRTGALAKNSIESGSSTRFDAWIAIQPDNVTVLQVSQVEMGQGIHTTFPAVIAEEMDADWTQVKLEFAPHNADYFNPNFPQMFTGNAESIRSFWPILRKAGANVRDLMIRAAAVRWDVDRATLQTKNSRVQHPDGRSLSYAELSNDAALLYPTRSPAMKPIAEWNLLRTSLERRDLLPKITGAPVFGLDATIEGMVYAAIRHADTPNGSVMKFNPQSINHIQGILDVVELPNAVAVVARSTWPAIRGAAELEIQFSPGSKDSFSTTSLNALYAKTLDSDAFTFVEVEGDVELNHSNSSFEVIEQDYLSAWQAHATMEPMNCIADVKGDQVYILAPTQGQTLTMVRVAAALGIPEVNVQVDRTLLGGGFGRRLIADFAVQAALVSKAIGKPVQIVWSRKEDIRNDYFRPQVRHRLIATIDSEGLPISLDMKVVSPTVLSPVVAKPLLHFVYPQVDPSCIEGMTKEGLLYDIENSRLGAHMLDVPVKTMVWRTTGYGPNVFAIESLVDELALHTGADPLEFRMAMLRRTISGTGVDEHRRELAGRAIAVLEMLRDKTTWGTPIGMAQGVAFSYCFETIIAQVVDVSVDDTGTLDIHKVTTVLDGGYVLDPDITQANIEGGVYWGLTQALTSEITFEEGRAVQGNFDEFEILALPESPGTELYWIDSGANPGGLGEVGPVTTAPALVNAIASATGRRLRSLPLKNHGIHSRYRKRYLPPQESLTQPKS